MFHRDHVLRRRFGGIDKKWRRRENRGFHCRRFWQRTGRARTVQRVATTKKAASKIVGPNLLPPLSASARVQWWNAIRSLQKAMDFLKGRVLLTEGPMCQHSASAFSPFMSTTRAHRLRSFRACLRVWFSPTSRAVWLCGCSALMTRMRRAFTGNCLITKNVEPIS